MLQTCKLQYGFCLFKLHLPGREKGEPEVLWYHILFGKKCNSGIKKPSIHVWASMAVAREASEAGAVCPKVSLTGSGSAFTSLPYKMVLLCSKIAIWNILAQISQNLNKKKVERQSGESS